MKVVRLLVAMSLLALPACGSDDDGGETGGATGAETGSETGGTATSGTAVAVPARIADAGEIVFCTAPPYPPVIFQEGDEVLGSDIDIGDAIAEKMGVSAEWVTIGFDGFIAAVQGGTCDGYLGASTHTEERAEQVHFTDYVTVGRQYLVPAGNPLNISSQEDLCGKDVSVLIGTTEEQVLKELSDTYCADNDLEPINVVTFNVDTDAGLALVQDQVDAYGTDSPGLTFYIDEYPDQFEYALPEAVDQAPWGIATRLDDTELHDALQQAVDLMYEDGTMCSILAEWGLEDIALQPC
jgi:polar amino acid transport system substrate-binding protein